MSNSFWKYRCNNMRYARWLRKNAMCCGNIMARAMILNNSVELNRKSSGVEVEIRLIVELRRDKQKYVLQRLAFFYRKKIEKADAIIISVWQSFLQKQNRSQCHTKLILLSKAGLSISSFKFVQQWRASINKRTAHQKHTQSFKKICYRKYTSQNKINHTRRSGRVKI